MRKKVEIAEAFAPRDMLEGCIRFFLVGIGGAGMSGLAKMLRSRGLAVLGTDSTVSRVTAELETDGVKVRIGHSGEDIAAGDAIILSDAIDLDTSPEVKRARELGLPLFRRSQLLGWLLRDRKLLAVTGTHGKSTTTGMLGAALRASELDPTIFVGAGVPEFGGPVVQGTGEFAVVEACEAYDSFHDLDPYIVVLTNLELDHADFHGTYECLLESVVRFVTKIPDDGCLVYCADDAGARDVACRYLGRKLGYGRGAFEEMLHGHEEATYGVEKRSADIEMTLPGEHNKLNAAGAMVAAVQVGANPFAAMRGIAKFSGAERRLQVVRDGPIVVVDDYAHHPSEIVASIGALRERYPDRRMILVFQPHLYSRTADLIPEFAVALSGADVVVLTDIYPAREAPMPGVSSARIAEFIAKPTDYVPSRHLLPQHVIGFVHPGDLVVGMGAGSISEFVPAFLNELERGQPIHIAVAFGGDSAEREVSIHSGLAVQAALIRLGYKVSMVDVTELLFGSGDVSRFVGPDRPHLVFLAGHGTNSEDGAIQGFLELLHIPYTGSGVQSSAVAMDKQLTKDLLKAKGIKVPTGKLVSSASEQVDFEGPFVVKPNAQGSTVGLSFVEKREDLREAIEKALRYDKAALVEEWVRGIEISVPVLGDRALPPVEIVPASGQYDFASKYLPGATEEIVPARLPASVLAESQRLALQAHQALGCEGATRTDMMVRDETAWVLEINTLPGLTGTSLLPNSARAAGISFDELVQWIVQDALKRYASKT